ncbi:MAG: hypothetical protein ACFCVE_12985 [Phycisphaerae bacterium]
MTDRPEQKALPEPGHTDAQGPQAVVVRPAQAVVAAPEADLAALPWDEISSLAEDLGLDPTRHKSVRELATAVADRKQLIESLDREAMLEVVRWGRRPVPANASKQHLAGEIARVKRMRFDDLSDPAVRILALLRGCELRGAESRSKLTKLLYKREGLISRLGRKRRAWMGGLLERALGNGDQPEPYAYLPEEHPAGDPRPDQGRPTASDRTAAERAASNRAANRTAADRTGADRTGDRSRREPSPSRLKHDVEESGVFGGLTNRIKKTADAYLNQKLDEVEARIDRKLDEIDRRLAEWRDKEIANRIRILKITLWVSLVLGAFSLIYSWVKTYWM